jgi:hypothetical protein
MPNKRNHSFGKSPYQRGNRSRRGRGAMLVLTVIILLIATASWITAYTRSVATTKPQNIQTIDPGAKHPAKEIEKTHRDN